MPLWSRLAPINEFIHTTRVFPVIYQRDDHFEAMQSGFIQDKIQSVKDVMIHLSRANLEQEHTA